MSTLKGIPATGLWGLRARAEEQNHPQRLFLDPLAEEWYAELKTYVDEEVERWYSKELKEAIALRTAALDHWVNTHIQASTHPVVIELGCGFSTRFSRLATQKVRWYELDIDDIITMRKLLSEDSSAAPHYLSGSVFNTDWLKALEISDASQVLLIAEGLFMYFPQARFEGFLKALQKELSGATLLLDLIGGLNLKAAQVPAEAVKAPIYWGVDHLERFFETYALTPAPGWQQLQTLNYPEIHSRLRFLQRHLIRFRPLANRMGGLLAVKV